MHRIVALLTVFVVVTATSCSEVTAPAPTLQSIEATDVRHARGGEPPFDERVVANHVATQTVVGGAMVIDRYGFQVTRRGSQVSGRFHLYQTRRVDGADRATVIASGEVICVSTSGNRARAGGVVDHTSFPEGIPEGHELTWSVTDNGHSQDVADSASEPLGNDARAYCALGLPYDERPLDGHKVTIRN